MSCKHDCDKPAVFPRVIYNRPALGAINYRIGSYADLRSHLLDRLNKAAELSAWTHRGADDPGIALLEGAAVVGDVLTFYQNLFANETFLRTAVWKESVAELVQLLGYRLTPGIGGEATFALTVKGTNPVTVPKSFGFKAQLAGQDQPAEFESAQELIAYPHLGQFRLYRPRLNPDPIQAGLTNNQLELKAVNGKTDAASLASVSLKKGDRVMLVSDSTVFDTPGASYSPQPRAEVLLVAKVETVLDRVSITFAGSLTVTRGTEVNAYVLGRSFRHFGYNAPSMITSLDSATQRVSQKPTNFVRSLYSIPISVVEDVPYYTPPQPNEVPLDQEISDLAAGSLLICQGAGRFGSGSAEDEFTVVKQISKIRADALLWGGMAGSGTVVTLTEKLILNTSLASLVADIRRIRFHEVVSPKLTLRAPTRGDVGAFSDGKLLFYGTRKEALALARRDVLLVGESGKRQEVQVSSSLQDFPDVPSGQEQERWMWPITLAQTPEFSREDFDESTPKVMAYGNLVKAVQGKTEARAVLGGGDRRQSFQTFALPKSPLTYLLSETQTSAAAPELTVYVDSIQWRRVDTFFNSGPRDQVFVVREDEDGKSWVQFGDGKTGARLPSGRNNVEAVYRTGNGAIGSLKAGSNPQAVGKLTDLDKVFMPGPAIGGADPETQDCARAAAPGKMQSLGRLVSLADYEAETLALPGVLKARADWVAPQGVPFVRLTVLTKDNEAASAAKIQAHLQGAHPCPGVRRFPLEVLPGARQYVYVSLRVGYGATRQQAVIRTAIKEALGVSGEEGNGIDGAQGLFGVASRQFGMNIHISQIIAAAQQVDGVTWVEVDAAQLLEPTELPVSDPKTLSKPSSLARDEVLSCAREQILALYTTHFELNLAVDQQTEGCAS